MRTFSILMIAALLTTAPPASADFAMLSPEPTPPDTTAAATPPPRTPSSEAAASPPSKPGKAPHSARHHRLAAARGFGKRVPLAFAVRQIVPASVDVRFAKSTDLSALVDWEGGRNWPAVLRDVVRPLGLRVTLRAKTVSIEP